LADKPLSSSHFDPQKVLFGLQERAKKGLGHIDGIISYVHTAENE
jgi:hypothetical protein